MPAAKRWLGFLYLFPWQGHKGVYLTVTGQFSTNGITKLLLDNPSPHGTDLALNELTAPAFWDQATHWSFLGLHHGVEFSDL